MARENRPGIPESFLFSTCAGFFKSVLLLAELVLLFSWSSATDSSVQSRLVASARLFQGLPSEPVGNFPWAEMFETDVFDSRMRLPTKALWQLFRRFRPTCRRRFRGAGREAIDKNSGSRVCRFAGQRVFCIAAVRVCGPIAKSDRYPSARQLEFI